MNKEIFLGSLRQMRSCNNNFFDAFIISAGVALVVLTMSLWGFLSHHAPRNHPLVSYDAIVGTITVLFWLVSVAIGWLLSEKIKKKFWCRHCWQQDKSG
jgi:hypothetical protein